jgi:hypothetical protein
MYLALHLVYKVSMIFRILNAQTNVQALQSEPIPDRLPLSLVPPDKRNFLSRRLSTISVEQQSNPSNEFYGLMMLIRYSICK